MTWTRKNIEAVVGFGCEMAIFSYFSHCTHNAKAEELPKLTVIRDLFILMVLGSLRKYYFECITLDEVLRASRGPVLFSTGLERIREDKMKYVFRFTPR